MTHESPREIPLYQIKDLNVAKNKLYIVFADDNTVFLKNREYKQSMHFFLLS